MKKMIPVILLITVLPTVILVGAAVYVGNQLLTQRAAAAEKELANANEKIVQDDDEKSFVKIFDGKSLKGWEGNEKFFRIEEGAIVAGNLKAKIPRNEFLCTNEKYQDFELRLSAKLIGEGKNAGIQFRSKRIPNHHEMIGYQCDMGLMNGHSIWGYLYDESRRRKFLVEADPKKTDEHTKKDWNQFVIRCEKNRIQIWVNGFQTVDYVEEDKSIEQDGLIGLQIHSGPPAEAWYRDIRIKKL